MEDGKKAPDLSLVLCVSSVFSELRFSYGSRCYTVGQRGSGGIGRRASLRSWWPKGRRGSSPFFRTTKFVNLASLSSYSRL